MRRLLGPLLILTVALAASASLAQGPTGAASRVYPLPSGSAPSRLAEDPAGAVWFTSRPLGAVGRLDPATGATDMVSLGQGAQPGAMAVARDGGVLVADAAANLIYRIDPSTRDVTRIPVEGVDGKLELTALAFDDAGRLWFAGYAGHYGWIDLTSTRSSIQEAPGGRGLSALIRDEAGALWLASYKDDSIARIDPGTGRAEVFPLPDDQDGPKSLAADASGQVWVAAYRSRSLLRFDPPTRAWKAWRFAHPEARPYAVAVDGLGGPLVTEAAGSRLVGLDPRSGAPGEGIALTERGNPRALLPTARGILIAETGSDTIRLVERGALRVSQAR